jgi:ABC-type bacteriocin/lantibiotic exporter with double-glycine peptidase domain
MKQEMNQRLSKILHQISPDSWRYFSGFIGKEKRKIIWTILIAASQTLIIIPSLFLIRYAFDKAIPGHDIPLLIFIGLAILVLRILQSLVALWLRKAQIRIINQIVYRIRENIIGSVYLLPYSDYVRTDLRSLHSRIIQDTERIAHLGTALLSRLLPSLLISAALLVICFILNWYLVLIIITLIPLLYLANRYTGKKINHHVFIFQRAYEEFSKGVHFVLRYLPLTLLQSAEKIEIEHQKNILRNLQHKTDRMAEVYSLNLQIQETLTGITAIVIVVIGGISVATGHMTLGALLSFYLAAIYLNRHLNTITGTIPDVIAGSVSLDTLHEISKMQPAIAQTGELMVELTGEVELRHIQFSYGEQPILKDINLHITPGQRVAIIGANGAGKTTLLNLLAGLLEPDTGDILYAGYPLKSLETGSFRKQIGIVTQHPPLFPGTIRENIIYGSVDCDQLQLEKVLQLSSATGYISGLKEGPDTCLGDEGMLISGGEGQRIAIARALYRNPSLLILDEPTNHLDPDTIRIILDNLSQLEYKPAILLISHDNEVVKFADVVCRLEDGALVREK